MVLNLNHFDIKSPKDKLGLDDKFSGGQPLAEPRSE